MAGYVADFVESQRLEEAARSAAFERGRELIKESLDIQLSEFSTRWTTEKRLNTSPFGPPKTSREGDIRWPTYLVRRRFRATIWTRSRAECEEGHGSGRTLIIPLCEPATSSKQGQS